MSLPNGQHAWQPPSLHHQSSSRLFHQLDDGSQRTGTPVDNSMALMPEAQPDIEDERRRALFKDLYHKSESKISLLFADDGSYNYPAIDALRRPSAPSPSILPPTTDHAPIQEPPLKKAKRVIDEDDYGDDDDEDDEDATDADAHKSKNGTAAAGAGSLLSPSKSGSSPVHSVSSPGKQLDKLKQADGSQDLAKTSEDARKQLQEARNATEEAARRSFHTVFYTLENDRTAMLEQQQLEESEKQLQAEMENNNNHTTTNGAQAENHGSLSSANLGASSLTLKHLIARIDLKRDQVRASDAELRSLMNEVRKNRSKWASEENVNQEELYEAVEKVLTELKAHTEYSTPFLQRVNKRDAPDYYILIKQPMDLGTMTKKLKSLTYKSKADFVTDLNLIWDNCLKYNQDMGHPLRRMANGMRKEAEKLIPLIPDLVIRPRAEVEAEERRKQNGGEEDGGDDSDDEPIMSSRGRTAGTKGGKSRKQPADQKEGTPSVDQKPLLQLNGLLAKGREGSEAVDGSNGFGTPIGGSATPGGINGHSGIGSNADAMDIDGPTLNGMALGQALNEAAEQAYEDDEYKIWKQVTKKDRALIAKERYQLFKDNRLNVDAPALLRNKAGIRWYLRNQKEAESLGVISHSADSSAIAAKEAAKPAETLAEGMEGEEEKVVPAYYEPLTVIPDIQPKLQWIEDGEGHVINQHEEYLRLIPEGHFVAPKSKLTSKIDTNIRQIQETRKLSSKIGVIKQMQIQTQVYNNQFPKSNYEAFVEQDAEPSFIADDGPVIAPETCHNALQRSVAKILYHTGFEELQPSAIDTLTSIASDYFEKLIHTFNVYREAEKKEAVRSEHGPRFQNRFTPEEVILHTLDENGCDLVNLESYAKDDIDRLSTKLGGIHERMKLHLTELLRPALTQEAGQDGVGAFKDGSEQFVSGDFAEDLGEDFFGFKALGLDKEMGLDMLSVPLHLLQSRVRNQYQMQTQTTGTEVTDLFDSLPPVDPVTTENIHGQIGLIKNFFLAKLHANSDAPLVEDEELPVKQRRPRPRLGASGKIVSPQKRPPKEQIALAKKKKKMELAAQAQKEQGAVNASPEKGGNTTPAKKVKNANINGTGPNPAAIALPPSMERNESVQSQGNASQTDKDEGMGMMSPESIER
ncbi:Transcriptional activator SPT7 [Colletotrichum fructicola]|uniref:Transcriptional activator SPT7 n=1 Tax=Colletotrichum siamense TaxID=690259 RepID=UPI001872F71B|nr:Transcriptional activator SPT7 [Colletotrichum siamense]KAF4904567.1 Transcriptional activator SPT7 [Colletotrichum fructicola]KAI8287396.1 Transcriptional activator SPT7 [Colletotrichum sp. SAR11_57]KAF4938522.1 Transcriptional activator SPT7 [Colletotrichum fructicola]KAF5498913.1 Transcriptional activator SPT7 [Colletotrichum fructicola]KAF5501130.1 Transcriptional activator SPT7 [Colletotrichum siamense]